MQFVIARSEATKQSSLALRLLDCFASLAMTILMPQRVRDTNFVMAGLDPAIHLSSKILVKNDGCAGQARA
jgi:hypothetical protein